MDRASSRAHSGASDSSGRTRLRDVLDRWLAGTDRVREAAVRLRNRYRHLSVGEVEGFVTLLRQGQGSLVVEEMVQAGVPVETIYLELLTPAARRLGELWEEDECNFVEVTLLTHGMQQTVRALSHEFQLDASTEVEPRGHIVLTALSTEQHTLGLLIASEFFLRASWSVRLGPPLSPERLEAVVGAHEVDVLGVSVSRSDVLDDVRRLIGCARGASMNPDMKVLVGGGAIARRPYIARGLGADEAAPDLKGAPDVAHGLIAP